MSAEEMSRVIIGTTPTITYKFNKVVVSDIAVAILTIKANNSILVEKHLEDATVGEKSLSWTLTQSETLSFDTSILKMMINWKLNDGTRGASAETKVVGVDNHKREVI